MSTTNLNVCYTISKVVQKNGWFLKNVCYSTKLKFFKMNAANYLIKSLNKQYIGYSKKDTHAYVPREILDKHS